MQLSINPLARLVNLVFFLSIPLIAYGGLIVHGGMGTAADEKWYLEAISDITCFLSFEATYCEFRMSSSPLWFSYLSFVLSCLLLTKLGISFKVAVILLNFFLMATFFLSLRHLLTNMNLVEKKPHWVDFETWKNFISVCFTLFVILNPDFLTLSRYAVSDPSFSLLVCSFLFLQISMSRHYSNESNSTFNLAILLGLGTLICFWRPDGLVFIAIHIFLVGFSNLFVGRFLRIFVLLTPFLVTPIFFYIYYNYFDGLSAIDWALRFLIEGNVVDGQTWTYLEFENDLSFFFLIIWKKFVYFFKFWNEAYSPVHNSYRVIYFGIVGLALLFILRRANVLPDCLLARVTLPFWGIIWLHISSVIAYEFRYQMPMVMWIPVWCLLVFSFYQREIKE